MPLWGNKDQANGAPKYVAGSLNKPSANVYNNSTADEVVTGQKVGVFGIDANEKASDPKISHTGWVLKKEGTGGRAGRVQNETLVAGKILPADPIEPDPVGP